MDALQFEEGTPIAGNFWPHQASDGTVFYVKDGQGSSIYVVNNGQKVSSIISWYGEIDNFRCFGDETYFITDKGKIYTVQFNSKSQIQNTFVRNLEIGEACKDMLIRRKINGKELFYRPCDDPSNGIYVDYEKLEGCEPRSIHRGKLICVNQHLNEGTAVQLSPNIIVVNCESGRIIANDDSPLAYFCPTEWNSCSLVTLNTTTMESLLIKLAPPSNTSKTLYYYLIVGVHGGEIIVRRQMQTLVGNNWEKTDDICKAKVPGALKQFEQTALARESREKIKREEEDTRFAEVHTRIDLMIDEMSQIRLRSDALENENTELKEQLEELNGKYKKLLLTVGRNTQVRRHIHIRFFHIDLSFSSTSTNVTIYFCCSLVLLEYTLQLVFYVLI